MLASLLLPRPLIDICRFVDACRTFIAGDSRFERRRPPRPVRQVVRLPVCRPVEWTTRTYDAGPAPLVLACEPPAILVSAAVAPDCRGWDVPPPAPAKAKRTPRRKGARRD